MRNAFVEALVERAAGDERIVLITGDLGFGVLEPFATRFPDRFLNAGVAEQATMGLAAGWALAGAKVFVYSIANFPTTRCLEQIRNDVCQHGLDVTVVAVGGGLMYGSHGPSHHATEDLALLRALPGMTVVAPGTAWEARQATRALAGATGPSYLRLGPAVVADPCEDAAPYRSGRARVLRAGADVTIAATGGGVPVALDAATELAAGGIGARVVSFPTVKPLDVDALADAVHTTAGIVTVEDHSRVGGFGSAVLEALCDARLASPVRRVALPDAPCTAVGSHRYLLRALGVSTSTVAAAATALMAAERPKVPS
jgi:transketolase